MNNKNDQITPPLILAPAGNQASFLAAVAAGADAVYCGLKLFSARMEAKNFSTGQLGGLVELAHDHGTQVYVALNTLLKPADLEQAAKLLDQLNRRVKPDAVIVQDLAMVPLVQQTGFAGQIHLSTLATVSFAAALKVIRQDLQVDRVVLPRELNVDELKTLAGACPPGLGLEFFVHGALCYGVSGRCYWSSYLGGKSGLRGRCVQPCRRLFSQNKQTRRYFSCQDLSLDVLVKVLLSIPQVRTWKIEGRKKSPHYVYSTVQGYRMLRDHGDDPQMKKNALNLLARALGRPGTHYYFLPQRPQNPVDISTQTGSGLIVAKVKGTPQKPFLTPRETLLPGDVLRLGYEDEPGHQRIKIGRAVPKGGRIDLKPSGRKRLTKGSAVFLTDRREKTLDDMLIALEAKLDRAPQPRLPASGFQVNYPAKSRKRKKAFEMRVYRKFIPAGSRAQAGMWLSAESIKKADGRRIWCWLPPVVWPEEEKEIQSLVDLALKSGTNAFVLNAPWQIGFFKNPSKLKLWAGPFCNLTNALAVSAVTALGFCGAIISPELGREDVLNLPQRCPLPLGIVVAGNWPLCVSRALARELKTDKLFTSPKGEQAWVAKYGGHFWVYPNWKLDIRSKQEELRRAGYAMFVQLIEPLPAKIKLKQRPGLWNWDLGLR